MTKRLRILLCVTLAATMAVTFGHGASAAETPSKAARGPALLDVRDKPLEAYRKELLDLAFDAATAVPTYPLIKDRSRMQLNVLTFYLKLDQPLTALKNAEKIENWRRGAAYADVACYLVRHGRPLKDVQYYLDLAAALSDGTGQDWRRARIVDRIAQAHAWAGDTASAKSWEADLVESAPSHSGGVAEVQAMQADEETFDDRSTDLGERLGSPTMEIRTNASATGVELLDRFYGDAGKRTEIETKLRAALPRLPMAYRVHLFRELAEVALKHEDKAGALGYVNEAQDAVDKAKWEPQNGIVLKVQVARLRHRAGEPKRARSDTDAALKEFDEAREAMLSIDRAGVLRWVAETYHGMGRPAKALEIYKRAVGEGLVNPNSRPRAEDLAATCCSLAKHGIEPDAELWTRLREVRQGLGDPW